jgi:hypothetical protein
MAKNVPKGRKIYQHFSSSKIYPVGIFWNENIGTSAWRETIFYVDRTRVYKMCKMTLCIGRASDSWERVAAKQISALPPYTYTGRFLSHDQYVFK